MSIREASAPLFLVIALLGCSPAESQQYTPQEVVRAWSSDSSTRAINEAFPEEMLALAERWISRVEAGAPEDELHKIVEEGSQEIISNNGAYIYQSPDSELFRYVEAGLETWKQVRDRYPQLCLGFENASEEELQFFGSLPLQKASIEAILAGRKARIARDKPTPSDISAFQLALSQRLGAADKEALQQPSTSSAAKVKCNQQIAAFEALISLDPASRGRIMSHLTQGS